MKSAALRTISTFGVIAAVAGLEHGIGEVLQGGRRPDSVMILSWPDAPFFSIHAGEPAMTVIPNLLVSGILTVLVSLLFCACAVFFMGRKQSGAALLLISVLWLLVGGGFGPPVLGVLLGSAALLVHALAAKETRFTAGLWRFLARQWQWLYIACLGAWLLLFPGLNLWDTLIGVRNPEGIVPLVAFSSFGFLLLAILTGIARDHTGVAAMPREQTLAYPRGKA